MAEKKNIVIKLKYPTGQLSRKSTSAIKTVTEWNYKRIALALGGIMALVALALFFSSHGQQKSQTEKVVTIPQQPMATNVADVAQAVAGKSIDNTAASSQQVVRVQLTAKIVDSEPTGEISLPVKAGEKTPVPLYFFVELAGMKGNTVFHEWLLDGKMVSRKTVNISDITWRTSSRQIVAYTVNSNWTVRLVDDKGQVLTEKKFTVSLAK